MKCKFCGHPVLWDRDDRVWRHKEPSFGTAAMFCKRYGYGTDAEPDGPRWTPIPEGTEEGVGND